MKFTNNNSAIFTILFTMIKTMYIKTSTPTTLKIKPLQRLKQLDYWKSTHYKDQNNWTMEDLTIINIKTIYTTSVIQWYWNQTNSQNENDTNKTIQRLPKVVLSY